MSQILETIMLVAFGFSWPLSLRKNIIMKSARAMNLPFYILIDVGYIAGIAAKLVGNNITYVLAIYIINTLMVAANIVVYFINRRYDKLRVKR